MSLSSKSITVIFAALTLAGCATPSATFVTDHKGVMAKDLGVAAADITVLSRCQFADVPFGDSIGDFRPGICALTADKIITRTLDPTSGETRAAKNLSTSEVETISLHSGLALDQVQIRTKGNILALFMRPDSGMGFNNSTAKDFFAQLKQAGLREIEAKAAIGFTPAPAAPYYAPIVLPGKRK